MSHLWARLSAFYDPVNEPLRRKLHAAVVALVGLAVTAGVLAGSSAAAIIGALPALLVIPVERARRKVTPADGAAP